MIQHTNYCRQIVRQFTNAIAFPAITQEELSARTNVLRLICAAQKFMLPHGGKVLEDDELRALDEKEELHLPFPVIALEYSRGQGKEHTQDGKFSSSKAVLIARSGAALPGMNETSCIVLTPVIWVDHVEVWCPLPEAAIPTTGYLDRTHELGVAINFFNPNHGRIPNEDYGDEAWALLSMVNALSCSNVVTERSEPKKLGKKIKSVLPFDSYHFLTIKVPAEASHGSSTGWHRSPREHLRRGHIRRLSDSRRIWVNATVVAAGKGGKVEKSYKLSAATAAPLLHQP